MSDPREFPEDLLAIQRAVLRAGRDDAPPRGAERRAAVVLGVSAGAFVGTSTSTATATAVATKTAWFGVSATVAKVLGVAALSSVVASVAVHSALQRAPQPHSLPTAKTVAPALVAAPSRPVESPPPTETSPPRPEVPPPVSAFDRDERVVTTRRESPMVRPSIVSPTNPRPPVSHPTIGEEIALLDRARAAWIAGDAENALHIIDAYDEGFPAATFALESNVLRIDVLESLGRRSLALELGQRFLSAHPNESMSRHVRSLVDRIRSSRTNP